MKNKKLIFLIITILILFGLGAWFFGFRGQADFGRGEVQINGKVFKVEVADTIRSRAQGLSGREGMDEDYGMIFIFDSPAMQGFWMKDMNFPLDMIWIKGDSPSQIFPGKTWEGKIVGFKENVQPEPEKTVFGLTVYNSPEPVDKVLELNAGTVQKKGIKVGDMVKFIYEKNSD